MHSDPPHDWQTGSGFPASPYSAENHVGEELLDKYALGSLSAEAVAPIEEHLLECNECQSRLREADDFIHLLTEAASRIEVRVSFWERLVRFRLDPLWVAGLAMVVMTIPLYRVENRADQQGEPEVLMQSLRGPEEISRVQSGKPARLVFEAPDASRDCKVAVLNQDGRQIQETGVTASGAHLAASIPGLARGDYWVRLYCGNQADLVAEYNLNAE